MLILLRLYNTSKYLFQNSLGCMLQYKTGREHSGNAQTVKLVIGAYLLIRKTNGSTQRAFNLDP